MSYTIGYRMPMRDRPRVRVRLVSDWDDGPTEATRRAQERLEGLPDGTVVEALEVMNMDGGGPKGGDEKAKPQPQPQPRETPAVYAVWNRKLCMAYSLGPNLMVFPLSPSGLAYPSEDGGMSSGLPTNDALNVLVTADDEEDDIPAWMQDEAIRSLPDGSVVECLWREDGATLGTNAYLMYGRALAVLPDAAEYGGGDGPEVAQ